MTIFEAARETMTGAPSVHRTLKEREAEVAHERDMAFEHAADYVVGLVTGVLLARRDACYGSLAISDEQTDEAAKAIATHLLLSDTYELARKR